MTDHGLAGELPGDYRTPQDAGTILERRATRPPIETDEVLAICDRHLREVGRRNHLFGWLRRPGGEADAWLPVDGYYPRHRLVVLYRTAEQEHDQIYRERVPAHGLRLLELTPADLGRTWAGAADAVAAMLSTLEPATTANDGMRAAEPPRLRRAGQPAAQPPTPEPSHLSASQRASRFLAARAGRPAPAASARLDSHVVGIVVAVALVVLMAVVALCLISILGA